MPPSTRALASAESNARNSGFLISCRSRGSPADIIKVAMVAIHRKLREQGLFARMVLQVHDELVFDVPAAELERVRTLVTTEMEGAVPLDVPLVVDVGTGRNWREAH